MPDNPNVPTIDIYKLDQECANQPTLFAEAGLKYAQSQYAYRNAKLNLDVVKAETQHDARLNPQNYKLDKITDKSAEMVVTEAKEVKDAEKMLYEAELKMETAKALRDAWGQRGSMLKAEIELWLSNYFSDSNIAIKNNASEKIRERQGKRKGSKK